MRRREAYSWWSRLRSDRDPEIQDKFSRWYADPRNAAAFDGVKRSYGTSALLRLSNPATANDGGATRTAAAARYAVAASVAAVALALFAIAGRGPFGGTEEVMLATDVGEIREVSLTDGSKVTLDSATKVEIGVGRPTRTARLRAGRARFAVARSSQPFVIDVGKTRVSATNGVVDVAIVDDHNRIDVLAGSAAVKVKNGDARGLTLRETQAVAIGPDHEVERVQSETDRSWPNGMIQFASTPINDAVAEANRYSDQHILLGPGIAEIKVSGMFHVGDTRRLAVALAACFHLKVDQATNGNFILSANGKSASK